MPGKAVGNDWVGGAGGGRGEWLKAERAVEVGVFLDVRRGKETRYCDLE